MKIHHLNCGSMCPFGRRLVNGDGGLFEKGSACCHCLLIEAPDGLILVDTGMGTLDLNPNGSKLPWDFRMMMSVRLNQHDTALHQIRALGFSESDVTDIVLTHLDLDHAGGLPDFPNARVHIYHDEYEAAMNPRSFGEKRRYLKHQMAHNPKWEFHKLNGDTWQGFECVKGINAKVDILLVPTIGHTRGHCAIAIPTPNGWLMHCGDAYFYHMEVEKEAYCTLGFKLFQNIMAINKKLMEKNKAQLRALNINSGDEIEMFCSHDDHDFMRLSKRAA